MKDFVRFLAAWALVHESADEGWKAAVARGQELEPGELEQGPEAFVDGLAALVAAEKERLKEQIVGAETADGSSSAASSVAERLDAIAFELGELRGRMESMQASIDAIGARTKE